MVVAVYEDEGNRVSPGNWDQWDNFSRRMIQQEGTRRKGLGVINSAQHTVHQVTRYGTPRVSRIQSTPRPENQTHQAKRP